MESRFEPHELVWTREKSARFWDYKASLPEGSVAYFSDEVGSTLLRYVQSRGVALQGRVVDFGCGTGHLLEKLVAAGIPAEGVDFSDQSVSSVRARLGGNPLFRGAEVVTGIPTHLEAGAYDVVLLIETIEHLLDGDLEATAEELFRITKPGGHVVISTPNEEPLANVQTMCADCGAKFHMMQHVRAWSAKSLSEFMGRYGFRTVFSEPVYLHASWPRTRVLTRIAPLVGKRLPNLVFVGRKA